MAFRQVSRGRFQGESQSSGQITFSLVRNRSLACPNDKASVYFCCQELNDFIYIYLIWFFICQQEQCQLQSVC